MIMGTVFLATGKIETTVFDQRVRRLNIYIISIWCKKEIQTFPLDTITGVKAV